MKSSLGLIALFCFLVLPGPALAFDAGVRAPLLTDHSPGAVSVPFEIPIRQSSAVPQPMYFEIAIEGFSLDPAPVEDLLIGSLDLITDAGDFDNKAIYSNGPAVDGVRTWTLDWQLSNKPITATVREGVGLDAAGAQVTDPDFTLISFTVPGNYHGFRLMGLSLRFNQQAHGQPTPGVGAVNPQEPGNYLIRSRIESVAPESELAVSSARVTIGYPKPATALEVKTNRSRVRPGGKVRFTLRTTNGTRDQVSVFLGKRRLRRIEVGPDSRTFTWRAKARHADRTIPFRFKPSRGQTRRISIRVARHG